MKFRNKT